MDECKIILMGFGSVCQGVAKSIYLKKNLNVKFLALTLHLKQQKKEINNFLIIKKFYYKVLQIHCLMMMNLQIL